MADNKIQIKRSVANSTVTGLSNGELAFTQAGNTLHIGLPDGSGVLRIGGAMVPGTLTANQALVANATSGIDKVIVANLVPTVVWANGAAGTAGQLLTSNSTGVYWNTPAPSVVGSDTQVQFNDGGSLGADAGLTFNKTTDTLSTNNVLATSTVNAATLSVGTSVVANSTRLAIGTLVGLQANGGIGTAGQVLHSNGTTAYWAADDGITSLATGNGMTGGTITTTGTVSVLANNGIVANATGVFVAANSGLVANATGLHILTTGDTTLIANATGLYVNDATISIATSQLTGDVALGTQTSGNYVASVSAANGINGTVAAAEGAAPSLYIVANNGIVANSTGVWAKQANGISVDASGINVNVATTSGLISNTTGVWVIANNGLVANSTGLHVGTGNGVAVDADSIRVVAGTNGGLVSNSTGVFVTAGDGLIANATGVHVVAGNGISTSADALAVNGGSTLTVNTAGVHVNTTLSITSLTTTGDVAVNGNTKLGDATTDVASINARVNTAIVPSANITYDLGTNLLRWKNLYSSHVESNTGTFAGNLSVAGDLTVTGNLTTIGVSSLEVTDPLIKLAVNNTISDALYIGVVGHYNGSGNTTNHTGLVREPTNKNYYLFSTYGDEANVDSNQIIVTDPSFSLANLNSYLLSSGLVTNATHVAITANSTVNVAIVANTLTLSTALAGTSGGTGKSTMTSEAILVGNTTNGYKELTLGTSGHVLQSNGTALVYDTIDAGTF